MKLPKNKLWTLIEREDYAHYLFVVHCWEGYTYLPEKWGFVPGRFLSAEYKAGPCNLFGLKEAHDALNKAHFDLLFNNPKVWDNLHALTIAYSKNLFKLSDKYKKLNAEKLSNKELLKNLLEFQNGQMMVHVPRGPMWLLETPVNLVSDYLMGYLTEIAEEKKNLKIKPSEAFRIMIAPLQKSVLTEEKEEMARIGIIKDKKIREKKLIAHAKKYEWLEYGLQGKILDFNYFQDEFKKLGRVGYVKTLKSISDEIKELKKSQEKIIKDYGMDKVHQKIFTIVRDSMHTRVFSKYSQFYGYYSIENLLKELGRRGGLTLEQTRFLAPADYKEILLKHKDYSHIANDRMKHSVHISDKGKTEFYSGKIADKLMKELKFFKEKTINAESELIKGHPAYAGIARGRVKIINTRQEMVKMHQGNILVSHMTNPDIVPAMKMAAGIVTDLGGITCHAAIVARELKKPCVIGTKIATEVLKDGDEVEVDAEKGIIKIINK